MPLLPQAELLSEILAQDQLLSPEARRVASIELADHFAGAFLLPYRQFHRSATELHYDIDLIGRRFEVGFATVYHRLSTLQQRGRRGVPFIFVQTDKAGNISKRQSATAFHFSRVGGSCPPWAVHDGLSQPGRITTNHHRGADRSGLQDLRPRDMPAAGIPLSGPARRGRRERPAPGCLTRR